jgi:hypothetical protein
VLETGQPLVIKMQPPERMLAALKAMGIATPGQSPSFQDGALAPNPE